MHNDICFSIEGTIDYYLVLNSQEMRFHVASLYITVLVPISHN